MARRRFLDRHWAYQFSHAAHTVSHDLVAALHARGLSVAQWRVLATLYDDAPCTIQQLAARTLYQQTTLTKLVARMVQAGWVTRSQSALDARERLVALSTPGQQLAASLVRVASSAESKVLKVLDTSERTALAALLVKINSARKT
jgi:DNA-binding MarR family transcriptional regulator